MLRDSTSLIKNVHIVNLNTEKGTFSNDYGQYRIVVSLGDTLRFSSVEYETVKKTITDRIYFSKKLNLVLKNKNYVLNEIVVKKHDLTGNLSIDRKKVPEDTIATMGKNLSTLIDDISKKSQKGILNKPSKKDSKLAEESIKNTDPTKSFDGLDLGSIVGGLISLIPKKKNKKKNKKQSIQLLKNNLLSDFGYDFFEQLKIPEEKITPFLYYCSKFNIEEIYEQGNKLNLLKLLENKSSLFLKQLK
ncbi:carboxypeptidase-like regulatory domain-containing protein [Flavobacteriaceae bacterium]|nr:carboxypeptidase-like regulatory domain-containing protein [Flavobacteriaceae bacterium]